MRLVELKLRNYRNYGWLDLTPNPGLNLFLGSNGQGKTNLLESIAMLALSSSPRARREVELIGPLATEARIEAVVDRDGVKLEIEIRLDSSGRRRIQVDGQPRRAYELPGSFPVSLFWPDDLALVKAGPDHRRRLLNQLLVQVQSGYARSLNRYRRVVDQRNHLLKQVASGLEPAASLDVWDLELARLGSDIVAARAAAVAELEPVAAAEHARIAAGEELEIAYEGPPEDLLQAVQNSRALDLRRGITGVGPHRDDIAIRLGGQDARSFASQGQQRTAVISLKLAEACVIETRTGQSPVLLLDDVLSELDPRRRSALLGCVSRGWQVVITSVEATSFPTAVVDQATVRCVQAGAVVPCG